MFPRECCFNVQAVSSFKGNSLHSCIVACIILRNTMVPRKPPGDFRNPSASSEQLGCCQQGRSPLDPLVKLGPIHGLEGLSQEEPDFFRRFFRVLPLASGLLGRNRAIRRASGRPLEAYARHAGRGAGAACAANGSARKEIHGPIGSRALLSSAPPRSAPFSRRRSS